MQLHAQTSRAGDVEAELDGRDIAGLMVGRGRHVRPHDRRRIEKARPVLDARARKRFGVVAGPHFVEVFHCAELHAAAARGAGLDQHIGIFGPNAFHDLVEALRIIDPEMRLFVLGQVLRPCIFDVAVGIPLDIVDIGREFHRIVEYREDEILHLRIAQIEKPLVAHTGYFAVARLHDPVGMFLGQFASGVHHLRLDPDTEFHPLLVGVRCDVIDALGQFLRVDLPVAESRIGVVARIFVAEPPVVQHEHFQPHVGGIVDHLRERLGIEREIGALPAVEQRRGVGMPVPYAVVARPVVQVAARAARAFGAVSIDHLGRGERLARAERVVRRIGIGAGQNVEHVEFVHFEVEAEITAPCQCSCDHLAVILVERLAVERNHEGRILGMRRAYLLARLDALRTMREQRVVDLTFARPRAVEVCQQVTACLDGQRRRIEAVQHDAALLPVADDCVRRDDVLLGIGRIE